MNYDACWVSHPDEWQPHFEEWSRRFPDKTRLHTWDQFGGHRVVGLTVAANANADVEELSRRPFRLLITVPHPHEPAPTAAAVNVAHALLTGAYLDESPSLLPRDKILANCTITFLPDTNSQGRARSPQRCWDGTAADNDDFLKIVFGVDQHGERFGRYPEWRLSEHRPQLVGIEYEQIDDDLYVEPNTSRRSTHTRAVDDLFGLFRYTHMLDMHQHQGQETIHLPADYEELSPHQQTVVDAWATKIMQAWEDAGSPPRAPFIPYKGTSRQQFFKDYWRGRCPGMVRIVTEIRNNRIQSGPDAGKSATLAQQLRLALAAIEATLNMTV